MATELVQLAVGNYDVTPDGVQSGVHVRDVTAKPITARILPDLQPFTGPQLAWLQARVGPYPFDLYGSLVVQADLGFALETQTLELIDTSWFDDFDQGVWEPTELHELTHMWFGDSVSPKTWSDLWLNEGHASWYEFLYARAEGRARGRHRGLPRPHRLRHTRRADEGRLRARRPVARRRAGRSRRRRAPTRCSTSSATTAARSCSTRCARSSARQTFQRIERAWVQRYEGRSASTDDFIALASQVSGRNLTGFLRDWLYGTKTPPMPGHPDWKVDQDAGIQPLARIVRGRR